MLSRVADALFWMSRYIERAEQVARLLDSCFNLELDLHGVVVESDDRQWTDMLSILAASSAADCEAEPSQLPLSSAMLFKFSFDMSNPASIIACVNRARNNARSIRGSISSEMWRELNKLYWKLSDEGFRRQTRESPHDLFQTVQLGGWLFQGLCDGTMTHDEGWRFIQLGKYLERADKTLRILDVKRGRLSQWTQPSELPLATLHWASVLKTCQAYEAYQRLYISRVEGDRVVEFLLLNPGFPYSVRFCLERAAEALTEINERPLDQLPTRAGRALGRALSSLKYGDFEELLDRGIGEVLISTQQRCAEVSVAVQEQYSLH